MGDGADPRKAHPLARSGPCGYQERKRYTLFVRGVGNLVVVNEGLGKIQDYKIHKVHQMGGCGPGGWKTQTLPEGGIVDF